MLMDSRSSALLSIYMCNHGSRVDWLMGLLCGNSERPVRVSYLTEGTMQFLPIVGWMRYLCEDIFLWRSFKVDKPRIDANIASFKRTQTQRAIFLAVEGAIVDKGAFDQQYIADCSEFCKSLGYEPFEYLLTPRYKGIHSLAQHAGDNLFRVTMCFVRDGKLLNTKLTDPERVVPDLYTLMSDPIQVVSRFERLTISAEQEEAKRQCMDDYKARDELIGYFHKHGTYPGGDTYRLLDLELPKRVACFVSQLVLAVAATWLLGMPLLVPKFFCALGAVVGVSHSLGEVLSGTSRESIPFETIFKSWAYAGRDALVRRDALRASAKQD